MNKQMVRHGESSTKLYTVWSHIKKRCLNKNNPGYKHYGGRGIKVCDEWRDSYISFRDWSLLNGYVDTKTPRNLVTIDRIDNDGNYEPSNCRWVTGGIQARNTRVKTVSNKSGFRGVDFHQKNWRASIMVDRKHIHIGSFKTAKDAGIARDKYVVDNDLEHTLNFSREELCHG